MAITAAHPETITEPISQGLRFVSGANNAPEVSSDSEITPRGG